MDSNHPLSDWHREDILAAIRKKKKSMAALSREFGLSSGTLINTLNRPWLRGERIIAGAIGVKAEEIWPSRYQLRKQKS
nr:helix-turn-helix transcriptional regulator [Pantoea cypripedii]